jgi:transposase
VQRTFGWLRRQSRLANDYERMVLTSENLMKAVMIRLMLRRLASGASILQDRL